MVHLDATLAQQQDEAGDKGLKGGALGYVSSVVVGVASTAPAYSLAATLGFVVIAITGCRPRSSRSSPSSRCCASSYGYKALNSADPDCGTTFTWGARAFGPKTGWLGGWGIVVADILVMASLAQVAGHTCSNSSAPTASRGNATSGWVLLVGVGWIVVMTAICYVGIEISANFQKVLLSIEITMLLVLSVVALTKVGTGHAPLGHLTPSLSWFNPFDMPSPESFMVGLHPDAVHLLGMGHRGLGQRGDRGARQDPGPGRRALHVHPARHLCAGDHVDPVLRRHRHHAESASSNPNHNGDVLSVLGTSMFGTSGFGTFLTKLLVLMVLSSAAASTQTTILPTARTTLSMAVFKAIPTAFAGSTSGT